MSIRAVILGLLVSVFLAAFCYLNDLYFGWELLIGSHLPVSVYGLLLVIVLLINPLLYRIRPQWRLSTRELVVAVCIMLAACSVPGSSLMKNFTMPLALPAQMNLTNVGWQKHKVLSLVPPAMLPADGKYDPDVLDEYIGGGDGSLGLADIPWGKWEQPIVTWMPMALLLATATICLSLIVHKQWTVHERLRYPIADVAMTLMAQEEEKPFTGVFRQSAFWIAMTAVLVMWIGNSIYFWSSSEIKVPLRVDFSAIGKTFTQLYGTPGFKYVVSPDFYPVAIGFAFFLASDLSLSIGVSMYLHFALIFWLLKEGIGVQDDFLTGGTFMWQRFGSCLGIALVIGMMGRSYYWQVLKAAAGFRTRDKIDGYVAWAFRIMIAALAVIAWELISLGLDWPLAILLVLLTMMFFLVLARINAEAGLFFMGGLWWQPMVALLGLFGSYAMGPKAMVICGLFIAVLIFSPRETLMPFMVNILKMGQQADIKPNKMALASMGTFVLALAVALPATMWVCYRYGMPSGARTTLDFKALPTMTFNAAERAMTKMASVDELQQSFNFTPWQRVTNIRPDKRFLWSAGLGLLAVWIVSTLRLRYTWWPIHPLIFCIWGTYSSKVYSASFLLGWLIKTACMRFGLTSGKRYQVVKAFMIGLIAGDILAGFIFLIFGPLYTYIAGAIVKTYYIFPN